MEYVRSVQSGQYRESGGMVLVLFSTEIGVHPPAGDAGMYKVLGALTPNTGQRIHAREMRIDARETVQCDQYTYPLQCR